MTSTSQRTIQNIGCRRRAFTPGRLGYGYRDGKQWLLRGRRLEPAERIEAAVQGLHPLREAEAHLASAERGVVEKARGGHRRDGDLLDQVPREGDVVVEAEAPDPRHQIVRPVGGPDVE